MSTVPLAGTLQPSPFRTLTLHTTHPYQFFLLAYLDLIPGVLHLPVDVDPDGALPCLALVHYVGQQVILDDASTLASCEGDWADRVAILTGTDGWEWG